MEKKAKGGINKGVANGETQRAPSSVIPTSAENKTVTNDVKKYSKRQMSNNWEKYEEIDDNKVQSNALDFAQFASQKASLGGHSHFRFSNEKDWNGRDKASDYLKLDVKDLCADILCVPLHERLKLNPAILTSEQIRVFVADAKLNEDRRMQHLRPLNEELNNQVISILGEKPLKTDGHDEDSVSNPASLWLPVSSTGPTDQKSNQSTWEDGSTNYFNLGGVEEELDSFLSMPQSTILPEGNLFSNFDVL